MPRFVMRTARRSRLLTATVLGATALFFFGGCKHHGANKRQSAATASAPERLPTAQLTAFGDPPDSMCRGYREHHQRSVAGCTAVGPYSGELGGVKPGVRFDTLPEALDACGAEPACVGVSSSWYGGVPWRLVTDRTPPQISDDSYGCFFVLRCPGG